MTLAKASSPSFRPWCFAWAQEPVRGDRFMVGPRTVLEEGEGREKCTQLFRQHFIAVTTNVRCFPPQFVNALGPRFLGKTCGSSTQTTVRLREF
jgi:hypothetical protein